METGEVAAVSRRRQIWADAALLGVTFIWGSTFVMVKDIIEQVPPMLFVAVRFTLGAVALVLVVTLLRKWRGFSMRELAWGSGIGVILGLSYTLQTVGLQYTSASHGAFVTGLLVVLAPIMGIFVLRQMPGIWPVLGVFLATLGLGLLSLRFEEGIRLNWGDVIVLGGAFGFALQVVLVSKVASWCDPLRMSMVQVLMAGLFNALGALLFESPVMGMAPEIWAGAAFLGLMATALAVTIQVSVQSFTTVVHASLIYTMEPVFAAVFGIWLQGDRLGPIALTGAALIVAGMVIAELGPYMVRTIRRKPATNRPRRKGLGVGE
jgi:drug/metabolite transporter (DMT)-like permease